MMTCFQNRKSYLPGNNAKKKKKPIKISIAHKIQSYVDMYVNYKVHSIKNTSALHITLHTKT